MIWIQEFWNKIFPDADPIVTTEVADVILRDTGVNITHFTRVLCAMTGHSPSEIKFYTEKMPVAIFRQLPKQSAIEVAQALESTGATVELRFNNKV
jgi:hypothetical protein